MLNFYHFPEAVRVTFSMLTVLNAGFAALVLILHLYRFKRGLSYWLYGAVFLLVLCQTVINAALVAQVYQNISDGFIVASEYIIARYIVFSALAAVFFVLLVKEKSLLPGIALACSFLTLPVMETLSGPAFPAVFSAALAILLAGSIGLTVKIRRELITSISGLSVKQAMDSLDTAVLFCGKDGHILMQNHKMQELMRKTADHVFYNGRVYLETIVIPNSESAGEGSSLYRLPDGVWLFSVNEINVGRKTVTRITAADVTEQNKAAMILRDRHIELESQRQRLKAFVENIENLCRSEELLRVKTEIHDAQNQKLILLLQYLRYGELPDETSFESLKTGVLQSTYANMEAAGDPQAMLDIIVDQYEGIGIKINMSGNLPSERGISLAFMQIVQEAAANSVKHGYASEVHVRIMANGDNCTMRVTDNGSRLVTNVKEGSGIDGMRRYAERLGGKLYIDTSPQFALNVSIPRVKEGETDE